MVCGARHREWVVSVSVSHVCIHMYIDHFSAAWCLGGGGVQALAMCLRFLLCLYSLFHIMPDQRNGSASIWHVALGKSDLSVK